MSDNMMLSTVLFSIGAATAIGSFFFAMYKVAKRIDDAIGTDENGRTLSDRMGKVEYQLWPNDGGSLADKVNRVEKNTEGNSTELKIIKELVMMMVQSHQESLDKKPVRASKKRTA
jgi:hypothetical protein